jgi:hypothetical protein
MPDPRKELFPAPLATGYVRLLKHENTLTVTAAIAVNVPEGGPRF